MVDKVAIGPDGVEHRFPDDTPDEVIDRVMRQTYSGQAAESEPILRAPTTGERAGMVGRDVARAAESALVQAPIGLAQTPAAVINLLGRALPGNYEDGYAWPGSGTYNAPVITRQEAMEGMARATGDERYTYQPQTRTGRLTQAVVGGGAEGAGFAAVARGPGVIANTIRSGRAPTQTAATYLARDVAAEGLIGAGASGAGTGAAEIGGPGLGIATGTVFGLAGGRTAFSPSVADVRVRRLLSDIPQEEINRAREILDIARESGVDITGVEALSLASNTTGPELAQLYASAAALRGERDPASEIARMRVEPGGQFDTAFAAVLNRIRGGRGAGDMAGGAEAVGARVQSIAQRELENARAQASAAARPFYEELAGVEYPQSNVRALDARMEAAQREFGPNSPEAREIQNLRNQLRVDDETFITSINQLDNWIGGYRERVNAGDVNADNRVSQQTARVLGPIVRDFETQLLRNVPELDRARRQYAQARETMVLPVDRALSRIADRNGQTAARRVFTMISGGGGPTTTPIDATVLRRGFRAIAESDPRVAQDALSYYLSSAWESGMREMRSGRRSSYAASDFRSRVYGTPTQQRNVRIMFDEIDRARGVPVGTTFRAFDNFLDLAAASGQIPGVAGSRDMRSAFQAEAREGRVLTGAATGTLGGQGLPILNAVGRYISNSIEQASYDRIIEQFTDTGPGSIDRILRMAQADRRSREALIAASAFIPAQQVSAQYQEQ